MDMAELVSTWSKDPSTKVGAVIVDSKQRVVSVGFNGFPRGMHDAHHKLQDKSYKHTTIIHAETNAIIFADKDLSGCTIYSTFPICASCASLIMQKGITRVVYKPAAGNVRWTELSRMANSHMRECGIEIMEIVELSELGELLSD